MHLKINLKEDLKLEVEKIVHKINCKKRRKKALFQKIGLSEIRVGENAFLFQKEIDRKINRLIYNPIYYHI